MFMSCFEFLIITCTSPTYAIRLKYSLNRSHCLCFPYLRNVWKDFSLGVYISVAEPSYTRRAPILNVWGWGGGDANLLSRQIQNILDGGANLKSGRGRQPITWPIFPENCMKMKKYCAERGRAFSAPPPRVRQCMTIVLIIQHFTKYVGKFFKTV